jgi:CHAT domain-containing protein
LEKALGPEHPDVATALNNLAGLYRAQGRYAEAEPAYKRSLAIREKALGPEHPAVATALNNLAWLAFGQSDWEPAANYWRRSTEVIVRRTGRGLAGTAEGSSKGEAQQKSGYFTGLVKATHRLAADGRAKGAAAAEMFETAQWGQGSEAAASLAQMAARSAAGSLELAGLVRERQDLVRQWQTLDKALIAAKSQPPAKRDANAEKVLADSFAAVGTRLDQIRDRLAKAFPDYAAVASPAPVSVADVQAQLGADEALVLFLDTPEWRASGVKLLREETFVWVVTKSDVRWLRSELGTAALQREVAALRCGLDARAWDGKGAQLCADLLKLPPGKMPEDGQALPFDPARAHALYASLLGGARDLIKGKHLLVVPSGALTTLPFQVLVTEVPASSDLAKARWLIRDHAIAVLPSAASLVALRHTSKPLTAAKPMLGFANPLLDGDQKDPKYGAWYKHQAERARDHTGCAATPKQITAALRTVGRSATPVPQTARLADLAHIRMQTPLPETADEVCEVARAVGADVTEMRIGARATETEIKRLSAAGDLAGYRIVHFATHGLLAGQLRGTREPGLIMTPPAKASLEDDGYLSGSEIAGLKLDADWVILSACNTAGGAGEGEAAEALSGLARMFLYAGGRALLVSHWEVDSHAAVKLVTTAIDALAKDKRLGRAEALRRAMLAAMADTTRPANWTPAWHPSVWAPFVVVGEGAAAAR